MRSLTTFDFIVLCGKPKEDNTLILFLEQLAKVQKQNIRIRIILVPVCADAAYIGGAKFKEVITSYKETFDIAVVSANSINATEPRAYNVGLIYALSHTPSDYLVFMHETDVVLDDRLLEYYLWLYDTAYNREILGAVTFSTNTLVKKISLAKMFYSDDVSLRGTCFTRKAILACGPFDESLIYKTFEYDYASRVSHQTGHLIRVGKEGDGKTNPFIRMGDTHLTRNHEKLSFLKRACEVWIAHKWNGKGIWPAPTNEIAPSSVMNFDTWEAIPHAIERLGLPSSKKIQALFGIDKEEYKYRVGVIYTDITIARAINLADAFSKKPLSNFAKPSFMYGPTIRNDPTIMTHLDCQLEYPPLLWQANPPL